MIVKNKYIIKAENMIDLMMVKAFTIAFKCKVIYFNKTVNKKVIN